MIFIHLRRRVVWKAGTAVTTGTGGGNSFLGDLLTMLLLLECTILIRELYLLSQAGFKPQLEFVL